MLVRETLGTPLGVRATGDVQVRNGQPAICLPLDAKDDFPVGWVLVGQSYSNDAPSWSLALTPMSRPLVLQPGACVVFDVVPEGYVVDKFSGKREQLFLKINHTYIFRLSRSDRPQDTLSAVFCVRRNEQGALEYPQYIRLQNGNSVIPSCDAKRNEKFPPL